MKSAACSAVLALLSLVPCADADTIKLGGTGSAIRALQALGDAYRAREPEASFVTMRNLGSRGGKAALRAGAIDLAVSADELTAEERQLGLAGVAWLRTPFVLAAAPDVPISAIGSAELARIYAGDVTAWPDGSRLRLVLRPPLDSDNRHLKAISPTIATAVDQALQRVGMTMAPSDQDAADALETIPGALGTSTLGLIVSERRQVKVLALDGVVPTLPAIANGRYPHAKTIYLLHRGDASPATLRFLAFASSTRARTVLALLGFHLVTAGPAR